MRANCFLFAIALALAGCQTADDGLTTSATPAVSSSTVSAIAGDLASRLAEHVPPATNPVRLKSDQSEFAIALEAALKGWGYTVDNNSTPKDNKAVELAYFIQGDEGQLLAQVSTPSLALGRAYVASASGATPASPLSIMQRD
jgi:hypothetical protein